MTKKPGAKAADRPATEKKAGRESAAAVKAKQAEASAKQVETRAAAKRGEEDLASLTPGTPLWVDTLPETAEPLSPVLMETAEDAKQAETGPAVPQKVKLQPMRKTRDDELGRIDSATEVPPLRF
mgnify:FL=1